VKPGDRQLVVAGRLLRDAIIEESESEGERKDEYRLDGYVITGVRTELNSSEPEGAGTIIASVDGRDIRVELPAGEMAIMQKLVEREGGLATGKELAGNSPQAFRSTLRRLRARLARQGLAGLLVNSKRHGYRLGKMATAERPLE